MATQGNNVSGKYAELRDSFFSDSEKEYFAKIMKNPKDRAIHAKLLRKKADWLYKKAMGLITRVENGEFNEEQMARVEYMIAHYLAAIEDFEKVLELELTMDREL